MRFEMLGPMRVYVGQEELSLTRRERVLLATLGMRANQPVGIEHLIDSIWGSAPPRNARNQVQSCVSHLRKRLGASGSSGQVIATHPSSYEIRVDPRRVDALEFRRLLSEARTSAKDDLRQEALKRYDAAVRLWRGPALAGVDSVLLRKAATALDEEHAQAQEERIGIQLVLGAAGELVAELTDLVAQHPYRESLHGALMLTLYRAGRQADALAAYQRAHRLLVEEVGTEPGSALRDLHQRILTGEPGLLVSNSRTGAASGDSARHTLPRGSSTSTTAPAR